MLVTTIVRWGYKPTNVTFGGPTLYADDTGPAYAN